MGTGNVPLQDWGNFEGLATADLSATETSKGQDVASEFEEIDFDWAEIARLSRERWSKDNPFQGEGLMAYQVKTRSDLLRGLCNIFHRVVVSSQFTIDFQQDRLGIEEFYDPNNIGNLQDGKNYLKSLAYTCGNILEIMKDDLPDRRFFESLLFLCESLKLYDFDFKEKG